MPNRRHRLRRTIPFISLLFIGLLGFNRVALSPRFESYRTLDVVQLLVSGACFGAVMVGVIGTFVRPRH